MYRLRSVSGEVLLPAAGRFADARFSSGNCFVLEADSNTTVPMQEQALKLRLPTPAPVFPVRHSRRSLLVGGTLATFSLFGLGSGMTTAFAQHLLSQPQTASSTLTMSVRTTFTQHQEAVRAVAWEPSGKMVVSGGNDHLAFVWQQDGTVFHALQFDASVHALAWSSDGLQLVAGAANTVSFFDAHTGSRLSENAGQHTAPVTSLGWTAPQMSAPLALSAGMDQKAIVWNGQSHQPHVIFRQHTTPIEALAVLANTVASASQGGVARVWNALSGQEIHGYFSETQQSLRAIAFSSAGALALGCDDGIVRLWSDGRVCAREGQDTFGLHCLDVPQHLQGHTRPVRAIAFSPDGTLLATGGDDKKLIIWSVPHLTPLLIQPQQDALVALSWSPSGPFLAGALGSRVTIWQIHF